MELGVADQRGSQRVYEVREGSSRGDVLQDVRDLQGLAEMKVLNLSHDCGEDVGSV